MAGLILWDAKVRYGRDRAAASVLDVVEDDADDEATQAFRSNCRDLIILTLEREIRNISEIEQALERIKSGQYGVCASCDETIPYNRMRAIPWTRVCVDCAGGGMKNRGRGSFPGQQSLALL